MKPWWSVPRNTSAPETSFQVVLSQRMEVPVRVPAFDVYRALRAVNPSPYMYYLRMGDSTVLGSSPEMLVKVAGRNVEYRPIAGTRPRGKVGRRGQAPGSGDCARTRRNAPSTSCWWIWAAMTWAASPSSPPCSRSEIMFVERYSHVMHLVSQITGKLRPDADSYAALAACFPAGTLTGAPKVRAMEIIDELEPTRRGLYGGSVLYLDFSGNLNSCIVIRTVLIKDKTAYLQAGAGIVADSVPARETRRVPEQSARCPSRLRTRRTGALNQFWIFDFGFWITVGARYLRPTSGCQV